MWKQNKTRYLMEEHKKKRKDIEDMEQEKKEKAEERMTVSEKAFLAWYVLCYVLLLRY